MTLYTSDTDIKTKKAARTAFVYLLISLFCALFGAVYEFFSHGVYSYYMLYAFIFPLVCGCLPFNILNIIKSEKYPCEISCNLYHSGIATLTLGSVLRGVLDIYGTTNSLSKYYWIIGGLLVFLGITTELFVFFNSNKKK